jgi:hypothetical protein
MPRASASRRAANYTADEDEQSHVFRRIVGLGGQGLQNFKTIQVVKTVQATPTCYVVLYIL